jgi:DNA repair exonuclease SbcCD ATPase subunit
MIIEQLRLRGFKSYGNAEQVLDLNIDKGELILISGANGRGKSALIEAFEYGLYGKVKSNASRKWITLSDLVNQINGQMEVNLKFKSGKDTIEVKRGMGPAILELYENGEINEKAGKANVNSYIEKYVGMDIETFKSFISMSIDDFKNFISLSTEEKQILLDKLFNLEVINVLGTILKELNKQNKQELTRVDASLTTLKDSIASLEASINKAMRDENLNIQEDIDKIKTLSESFKEDYLSLKEKLAKVKIRKDELDVQITSEQIELSNLDANLRVVINEIALYDKGKCPTCATSFQTEHFEGLRATLVEKRDSVATIRKTIQENIAQLKSKLEKGKVIYDKTNENFIKITQQLKQYKSQIDELENKKKSKIPSATTQTFQKNLSELKDRHEDAIGENVKIKHNELCYKELAKILGEDGVKKSIIASIIKPINAYLRENIIKIGIPFDVEVDTTFTAKIMHMGVEISHARISVGERKRINMAMVVAYLKLIRLKKNINILFLDEVFASIDAEGVENILFLLKDFAEEYKINVFVVHHMVMNQEIFDRVYHIHKNIFSSIERIQ